MSLKLFARRVAIASIRSTASFTRSVAKLWRKAAVYPDWYSSFYRFRPGSIALARIEPQNGNLLLHFAGPEGDPIETGLTVNDTPATVIELPADPEPRRYDYAVAVSTPQNGTLGRIDLAYYPRSIYLAHRNSSPGQIVVLFSDIPIISTVRGTHPQYSAEDVAWAREEWPTSGATDIERAEGITLAVLKKTRPLVGIPSDEIGTMPREQYSRAKQGLDHLWCDNLAQILHLGLVSHGLQGRIIRTGTDSQMLGENRFSAMNSHATVEYYSRETKGWVWTDPSADLLNAMLNGVRLNLNQLIQSLDTPLAEKVTFHAVDETGLVRAKDHRDQRVQRYLSNYLRPGVKLTF